LQYEEDIGMRQARLYDLGVVHHAFLDNEEGLKYFLECQEKLLKLLLKIINY
jgi:hypothetical protein